MSNFYRKTKHPETGIIENAHWRDNYFGHHQYGFGDGCNTYALGING